MFKNLIELFFPEKLICLGCERELNTHKPESFFCEDCQAQFETSSKRCQKCDRPLEQVYDELSIYQFKCKTCQEQFHYYERHFSCTQYEGNAKKVMLAFKYKGRTEFAKGIAERMVQRLSAENLLDRIDVIVPTPIHWTRRWVRGYNQSELIAKLIKENLGNPLQLASLKRVKITKKLKNLDKEARKQMLKDAIIITQEEKKLVEHKVVLIIDDIYTTGATVNECSKVLYEAGAETIYCVTFAMGQ